MKYAWETDESKRERERQEGGIAIVFIAFVVFTLFVLGCRDNYQWVCW